MKLRLLRSAVEDLADGRSFYDLVTGSAPAWSEHAADRLPMVAEDGGHWPR